MAARQAPQLRVFRNDFAPQAGDRDPPRGRDEQPGCDRRAREHRDGSPAPDEGRTRRLRVPLAAFEGAACRSRSSQRIRKLTVVWPSGKTQVFTDVPLNARLRLVEGGRSTGAARAVDPAVDAPAPRRVAAPAADRCGPRAFPAPDFSAPDLGPARRDRWRPRAGGRRSCSSGRPASAVVRRLRRSRAGTRRWPGPPRRARRSPRRARPAGVCPRGATGRVACIVASQEVGLSYAIRNRDLFRNQQNLRVPTAFLVDPSGPYRQGVP